MVEIRRIKIGEAGLYKQVRLDSLKESPEAFGSTYDESVQRSSESWIKQVDQSATGSDRATFLVFVDRQPVGLAALYRMEKDDKMGELLQVWIAPVYRRQGLALKLMTTVFEWAKKNNFHSVAAGIMSGNQSAMSFYLNIGFKPDMRVVLNCPCDAAILVRDIK